MNGHALKELAYAWATVVHDGQCRKGAGEPYMKHCERVADRVWGWRRKTLALLHDTIEDSDDPEAMFKAIFLLFGCEIASDLMLLSRLHKHGWLVRARAEVGLPAPTWERGQKQIYREWIEDLAVSGREDVIAVKLADLEDNLSDIQDIPGAQSQQAKYLRAKATLLEAFNG